MKVVLINPNWHYGSSIDCCGAIHRNIAHGESKTIAWKPWWGGAGQPGDWKSSHEVNLGPARARLRKADLVQKLLTPILFRPKRELSMHGTMMPNHRNALQSVSM
jgi:hypothetical protein